ncbi:hypothetical protein QBC37DRAFT_397672 [Rhypophila decipiens]|uniref:Uncharacterized protein n=1 Tax=Rhypophila decipiens TaxID=261697 RepID=A0AAN6YHZ5_9PEZI|nr:hypothetical protein QBC37DRAFT_397672 [Rhypophila decipiens]
MHIPASLALAATLGAVAQAAPNILHARQTQASSPDEVVSAGDQICIGLSRGGSDSCFIVPDGCFVVRPKDNTIPTPVCEDGSKQTLIPVANSAPVTTIDEAGVFRRQLRCQPRAEDIVFPGNTFCMGFSPGSGTSCFGVPEGCIVAKPLDNTLPTPICADGSKQSVIPIPSNVPAAAPAGAPAAPAATRNAE